MTYLLPCHFAPCLLGGLEKVPFWICYLRNYNLSPFLGDNIILIMVVDFNFSIEFDLDRNETKNNFEVLACCMKLQNGLNTTKMKFLFWKFQKLIW